MVLSEIHNLYYAFLVIFIKRQDKLYIERWLQCWVYVPLVPYILVLRGSDPDLMIARGPVHSIRPHWRRMGVN